MTIEAPFISIIALLVIQLVAFAVGWGKIGQQLSDLKARVEKIEVPVGFHTGQSAFMRKADCPLLDVDFRHDFHEMRSRVDDLEVEVRKIAAAVNHREA